MNVQVRYFSKSGNTKKLADAIARAAGVTAQSISDGKDVKADVLFLGASVYWAGIDGAMKKFIEQLDPVNIGEVVVFSTSALAERAFPDIQKRLQSKGIKVSQDNFYCRGSFAGLHKGKPDTQDLQNAAAWTSKVLEK